MQGIVERKSFDSFFEVLSRRGYEILGPTLRDHAICYDTITSCEDLPIGWTDRQDAGKYRIEKRKDEALFGYVVGPTSWKKFLFPPKLKLWQADREGNGFKIEQPKEHSTKRAFLGVRACELKAIDIQDKVFLQGAHVDTHYASRRKDILIITVNCTEPGGTCFCVSMQTGPKADSGFDLSITEVVGPGEHYFLFETGSPAGEEILQELAHKPVTKVQMSKVAGLIDKAEKKMGRAMETKGIKDLLQKNAEHPRWDAVADRCLSCANCTMSCPTCFCSTVEDVTDLTNTHAERWRLWDSCFNLDFSYIHGGNVRSSVKGRYRQWMTHKLANWHDQFNSSGCVGCGRCITWCPVGIDITEEVASIRESAKKPKEDKQ